MARAGLFEMKRAAECLMPGAEAVPPKRAPSSIRRAPPTLRLARADGGPPVRTAPHAGRDRPRRHPRSGPARGANRSPRGDVKYTPIRRYPSSAFDLSVIAGLREHAGKLQPRSPHSPGRCWNRSNSCAQYSGPPLDRGHEERLVPPDGGLGRAHAVLRRGGRDPRRASSRACAAWATNCACEHPPRQARRLGARRQRGLCRWCGARCPRAVSLFAVRPCVHEWKLRTDPGYLRDQVFARDRGVCAQCGVDTEALRQDKRKLDYRARRQFEKEWGRPPQPMGRRPHRPGRRRRRRVRPVQHAHPVPPLSSRRDGPPPPAPGQARLTVRYVELPVSFRVASISESRFPGQVAPGFERIDRRGWNERRRTIDL